MKLAATVALGLLAACATPGGRPEEPLRPRPDLVAVSRAMTAIDAAERRGDVAALRARHSQAAQAAPRDPVSRFLAIYAQPAGEDRWAEFKALASELPDSALGQLGMARTYVSWNTLDQADRAVALALDLEPDAWVAVLVRAEVSERRGRLEAAAADYGAVLSADPANPEAHLGLARVARARGERDRARDEATAALKAAPDLFGAFALLGELAASGDDVVAAADFWTGAVEASPRDRAARVTLARLLDRKGDRAAAQEQWKAAVGLKEDADALIALAQAARASGDSAAEGRALERLSAIDPGAAEWRRIAERRRSAAPSRAIRAIRRRTSLSRGCTARAARSGRRSRRSAPPATPPARSATPSSAGSTSSASPARTSPGCRRRSRRSWTAPTARASPRRRRCPAPADSA
jgi:tetratricopeptide (TPR) repeat protein